MLYIINVNFVFHIVLHLTVLGDKTILYSTLIHSIYDKTLTLGQCHEWQLKQNVLPSPLILYVQSIDVSTHTEENRRLLLVLL